MKTYPRAIALLLEGVDLGAELAEAVMAELMDGQLDPAEIAALLTALAVKGETAEELTGFARAMRARAVAVRAPAGALDTCGTGGSGLPKPNVSTLGAFVISAAGVPVAKHGNRSTQGRCGSADLLERLGVPIDLGAEAAERLLAAAGMAFLFAPRFHPAMRHAAPIRRAIGFRTSFNFLGPLANPAQVRRQILGVSDPVRAPKMAAALAALGVDRALVFSTAGGLDELLPERAVEAWWIEGGVIERRDLDLGSLGLEASAAAATDGSPDANAQAFEAALEGRGSTALADLIALNAGAGLWVAGLAPDLAGGVALARELLAGRRAAEAFERYRHAARAEASG